jgi:hypothetical protein
MPDAPAPGAVVFDERKVVTVLPSGAVQVRRFDI